MWFSVNAWDFLSLLARVYSAVDAVFSRSLRRPSNKSHTIEVCEWEETDYSIRQILMCALMSSSNLQRIIMIIIAEKWVMKIFPTPPTTPVTDDVNYLITNARALAANSSRIIKSSKRGLSRKWRRVCSSVKLTNFHYHWAKRKEESRNQRADKKYTVNFRFFLLSTFLFT